MQPVFTSKDVKILEQSYVYQGYFQLKYIKLQYRLFNGGWSKPLLREIFDRGEAVGVLLFDPLCDQLILIEQFRVGTLLKTKQPWLLEIVAGMVEPGESFEQVAKRETYEETGLNLCNLLPISRHWVSPGGSSERICLFCAQVDSNQAKGIHGLVSEGEDIQLHLVSTQQAYQWVNEGEIDNAATIIALLWLQQNEKKVRQAWLSNVD